ncbi:MAG: hypothetical protein B7X95_04380 [Methylophilaceae bacterium 17-44-8]|nr:MAG: hypothetical protein B7Y48_08775 [Methylophilales bacterium 28-44-11]OZA06043.1 MAG: hypothetical protein B7X95_04380 [Methylophilaceae bacterium 17-44-8]
MLAGGAIRKLRQDEQRYVALLNDQIDLVSRVTNKGKILFANDAYLKFFGVTKNDVMGSNWHPLAHPDDLDMIYQRIKQISLKTPVVVIQNRVYDSRKQIRWVEFINHGIFDAKGTLLEIQSVGRDITDAQVHVQEIDFIAHHDVLTGLANRLLIGDRLKTAITNAKKNNKKVAVCCIDLDHFKPINDDYGHSYGDEVLVEISKRMTSSTRASDTIGRLGGDEFVLIFNESVSEDDQKTTIARLLVDICSPLKLSNGIIVSVSASAGVSSYPKDSDLPDMLLRMADERMYLAKTTGRNKVIY